MLSNYHNTLRILNKLNMNKYIYYSLFVVFSVMFGYTFIMYVFLPIYEETEFTIAAFICILPLLVCVLLRIIRGSGLKMTLKEIFISFIPIVGHKYSMKLNGED